MTHAYILTLSCPDRLGLVHAVSGFLLEHGGNIEEAAQYNDHATGLFFMRVQFACDQHDHATLKPAPGHLCRAPPDALEPARHGPAPMRTVLMVSKEGHCLNDLLFRWKSGLLPMDIRAIISNHRDFYQLAASYNVPFHHIPVTARPPRPRPSQAVRDHRGRRGRTGGAGALHADPERRPVPQAGRPGHQHPPQLPAQLQGRQALLPGA
jgi:formyltetrahydrofolate hydrolase